MPPIEYLNKNSIFTMINLQNWYKWSESKDDYYMLFIKAWIPFNVWYHDKYYDSETCRTDEKQIARVKSEANKVRKRIESLLDSDTDEGKYFRKNLTGLHSELNAHPQSDRNGEITLNRMWDEYNATTTSQHGYRANRYSIMEVSKAGGGKEYKIDIVTEKGRNVETFTIPKRTLDSLRDDVTFQGLNNTHQKELEKCMLDILEKKPSNIVVNSHNGRKPQNTLLIDAKSHFYLSNNKTKVAKVIIQLLYQLRCLIFHGKLEPTEANINIYKYAYRIQSLLNKELI